MRHGREERSHGDVLGPRIQERRHAASAKTVAGYIVLARLLITAGADRRDSSLLLFVFARHPLQIEKVGGARRQRQ